MTDYRTRSRSRGCGAAAWTPVALSPLLWLEAYDPDTLTPASPPFSAIADKSVNGNNFTQATSGSRPTLDTVENAPALLFDGTDDFMSSTMTLPAACTIAILCEVKSSQSAKTIFGNNSSSSGRRIIGINTAGNWAIGAGAYNTDTAGCDSGIAATPNEAFILIADFKTDHADFYVNGGIPVVDDFNMGSAVSNATYAYLARFTGGGQIANVAVSAVIVSDGNLTTDERNALGNYLAEKANATW